MTEGIAMTVGESMSADGAGSYPGKRPDLAPAIGEASAAFRCKTAESGAVALNFAGSLLAPERGEFREPRLACLLLRESLLGAARALTGSESLGSVSRARAALEARADLPRTLQGPRGLASCLVLERETPPTLAELLELEAVAFELVRWARGEHSPRRRKGWLLAAGGLFVASLVVGVPRLFPSWRAYEWQASSAMEGFPKAGTLGQHREKLVFHTGLENGPWVLIDMKSPRSVGQIVIKNRKDCCSERGLPLIVELGNTRETLAPVGSRTELFDEWTLDFAPRAARYVRLRSEAMTYLNLSDVEIP